MFVRVRSAVLSGPAVLPVTVEVESNHRGLPTISLIGLAHGAVVESKDRIFSALRSCEVDLPHCRTTMSLVPVDVPKRGSSLDLALAIGLLLVNQIIPAGEYAAVGELGLDGALHDCAGLLGLADSLRDLPSLFVPSESVRRLAPMAPAAAIYPIASLADFIRHAQHIACSLPLAARYWRLNAKSVPLNHQLNSAQLCPIPTVGEANHETNTLPTEWRTSSALLRVLSLAAAGGHHTLLFGSPGVGKTYAKSFLQALLPTETKDELYQRSVQLDVQTSGGWLNTNQRIIDPHHSITLAGLVGGGTFAHAGLISAAHHNWLFLDELPEFRADCLEALRQPLESNSFMLARAHLVWHLPCAFTLVATANPCGCGWFGTSRCHCTKVMVQRYLQRLSGPILDRIDVQYRVTDQHLQTFTAVDQTHLLERVNQARQRQRWRAQYQQWPLWARQYQWEHWRRKISQHPQQKMTPPQRWFAGWSRRRQLIVWRVAQTLADLDDQPVPTQAQWAEAHHLVGQSIKMM